MEKRGGIMQYFLGNWFIAVFAFVILVFGVVIALSAKNISIIEYLKNLIRFGR
jgi:hypothetical protein